MRRAAPKWILLPRSYCFTDSAGSRVPKITLKLEGMSSRHEENLHILEKFLYIIEGEEGGEGVFHATSFPSRYDVNGVEERVKKMAEQLSWATLQDWMINVLTDLGEKVKLGFDEVFQKPCEFYSKCF